MSVRTGQSVTVLFTTRVFATGVGTNADSLPTGSLYVNGTVNAATVTVTNISTGLYKAQVTLPTLAIGDEVELAIAATVSAITDSAVVWGDTKDLALDSSGNVTFNNSTIGTATVAGSITNVSNIVSSAPVTTSAAGDVTIAAYATGKDPATLVLNAVASAWNTPGTIGAAINAAGSAGDPWTTDIPGSYTSGQAGYLLGNLAADYVAPDNAGITAIVAKLPTNNIADETLVIDATNSILSAVGTPMQAGDVTVGGYAAGQAPPSTGAIATAILTDTSSDDLNTPGSLGGVVVKQLGGTFTSDTSSIFTGTALQNAPTGGAFTIADLLAAAIPTTGNPPNSVADCFNAARAQGFGPWTLAGTTLTLYASDGVTIVHQFTLNSATAPTQRT